MNGIYFLCKEQEQLYLRKSCGWRSRKYRWKEMNPSVNCINCRRQGWEWLHRGRGGCGEAPLPLAGVHCQGGDQEADVWRLPGQQQAHPHRGTLLRRHLQRPGASSTGREMRIKIFFEENKENLKCKLWMRNVTAAQSLPAANESIGNEKKLA